MIVDWKAPVQREGAALARHARQPDFAAQQMRKLAADGKPESRPAITPRRAGVGLLEGFEDDALLLKRYPDTGVADRELDHGRCLRERRVIDRPSTRRRADA
jgi:hypothetical protein